MKPLLECDCMHGAALSSSAWAHSRGGLPGAQACRSGGVDEGAREGDSRTSRGELREATVFTSGPYTLIRDHHI